MKKIITALILLFLFFLTSCSSITEINRGYCQDQCNGLKEYDLCMARCMSR